MDSYKVGKQTVICGSCLDAGTWVKKPDVIYTDPPYGKRFTFDFSWNRKHGKEYAGGETVIGDGDDFTADFVTNCLDKDAREVFVWGYEYLCGTLPPPGGLFVWDKGPRTGKQSTAEFEVCWSLRKHRKSIIRGIPWSGFIGRNQEFDRARYHPTQKPIKLAEYFISQFVKPGDIVIDPFCGAGAALLACEKYGIEGVGIEIDPRYVDVTVNRLRAYVAGQT